MTGIPTGSGAALVLVALLACSKPEPPPPVLGPDVPATAMAAPASETDDVSKLYSVTKDDDVAGLNRKVDVVLYKRQKRSTLEAIGRRIHASDVHQHEITFIFFDVLGEPEPPQMAHWAIARFEPGLTVQILGDEG